MNYGPLPLHRNLNVVHDPASTRLCLHLLSPSPPTDITKLSELFPAASFDVVIDKCTIDALTVDPGDKWDPNPETRSAVTAVVNGVAHLLKPHGVFVSITFEQKQFRRPLLEAPRALDVRLHKFVELGFKECYVFHLTHPAASGSAGATAAPAVV